MKHYSAIFLDRDGVINIRVVDGYVLSPNQFIYTPGAVEAIVRLSKLCRRLVVVTNQQCVGKGLLAPEELDRIHRQLINDVETAGGRIDRIYVSPHLSAAHHPDRKPGIGMGLRAQKEFPEIEFPHSLMIGDSLSDIEFARRLGIPALYIGSQPTPEGALSTFPSLAHAARALTGEES